MVGALCEPFGPLLPGKPRWAQGRRGFQAQKSFASTGDATWMEPVTTAEAYKESEFKMIRITSYLLVAAWGFNLVTRLLFVAPALLNRSPIAFADIAYVIAFSILLLGSLASLTPRYQRVLLGRRNKWRRKSRTERFRAIGGIVLVASLLVLLPFALVFVEMERSPGKDLLTYFLGVAPIGILIYAAMFTAFTVWTSRQAS